MPQRSRTSIALTVLGIIAIAVVIWFGQPLLPGIRGTRWADPLSRAAVAGALLGLWLLLWVIRRLSRHRRHRKLIKYLLAHADSSDTHPQHKQRRGWWRRRNDAVKVDGDGVAYQDNDHFGCVSSAPWGSPEQQQSEVREHFKGTLWAARTVRSDSGKKHSMMDLPWFLVIGNHGAGKGQFLENANLMFPMAEVQAQNPIRGSGSSRDCQWWIHQDAVLIEAAGRLVSQDSIAEDDQGDWLALLRFLEYMPTGPLLHSVLILVNTENLLDNDLREREIDILRGRMDELREHLGEQLRFQLILTHMDAIAGFSDSFEQASPAFRHQYWGIPIQQDDDAEYGPRLDQAWDDLLRRLDSSSMERLQAEPELHNRVAAFAFINQLGHLKGHLLELVNQLFDSQSSLPRLSAVFFSSATQTPARQDWLSGELKQLLSIDGQLPALDPDLPRGYFVRGPIHQYAIPAAAIPPPPSRTRRALRKSLLALILAATTLPLLSWSYNLLQNRQLIATLHQHISDATRFRRQNAGQSADAVAMLPYLDSLLAASQVFPAYAPLLLKTGLYQGDRLGSASKLAYQRALRNQWLPALTLSLETALLTGNTGGADRRRTARLYSALDDPDRLDLDAFRAWFQQHWQQQPEHSRQALMGHLDTLLHLRLQPQTIDYSLARRGR